MKLFHDPVEEGAPEDVPLGLRFLGAGAEGGDEELVEGTHPVQLEELEGVEEAYREGKV